MDSPKVQQEWGRRPRPVLVTGPPRSGTSFLGAMLAHTHRTHLIYEPLSFYHGIKGVPSPMLYADGRTPPGEEIASEIARLLAGKGRFKPSPPAAKPGLRRLARDVLGPKTAISYRFAAGNPIPRTWLLKDPWACLSPSWLQQEFGCRTVIIIRHPVPTCLSYLRNKWSFDMSQIREIPGLTEDVWSTALAGDPPLDFASPVEAAATVWSLVAGSIALSLAKNPDLLLVRHEDISRDPVTQIEMLAQKLGLTPTRKMKPAITYRTGPTHELTPANGASLNRPSVELVDHWKAKTDPAVIAEIRRITERVASHWYSDADWG